jgi:hypothetical protein
VNKGNKVTQYKLMHWIKQLSFHKGVEGGELRSKPVDTSEGPLKRKKQEQQENKQNENEKTTT